MDEGWGNLIYILAAAIFAIFSAFNKKKKAKETQNSSESVEELNEPVNTPTVNFEDIFGSLLGEEAKTSYNSEEYYQLDEEIEEEEIKIEEPPVVQETFNEKSVEDGKEEKESIFDTLSETYQEEEEDEIEIDWRNAIIYKEILDRKYN